MNSASTLPPIVKERVVPLGVERAFDLFTHELHRWWPLATHSISREAAIGCTIDPRVGGEVVEEDRDGNRHLWGTVLSWDPPHSFAMTWHPGREPEEAQRLEVRFSPQDEGCRVVVEHRGWERVPLVGEELRSGYDEGWEGVLESYVAIAKGGDQ